MAQQAWFSFHGVPEFEKGLEHLVIRAEEGSRVALEEAARVIEQKAKANASGPRPRVVTGRLRNSIKVDAISRKGSFEYAIKVGALQWYGKFVEARYPFMKPAVEQSAPELQAAFTRAWKP